MGNPIESHNAVQIETSKIPSRSLGRELSFLPPPFPGDLREQTRQLLRNSKGEIPILVALDDDPTGTQTCHGVNVLTVWDVPTLVEELNATASGGGFFILTNSRAFETSAARRLINTICKNLSEAAAQCGVKIEIVLRGDSTLRGHFPDEPEAVDETLGSSDAWILAPFFLQGGRYTIDDVHYVLEGEDELVPAGATPFAKDATFGYRSSNLRDWVVEKSVQKISRGRTASITIPTIRQGGPDVVRQQMLDVKKGSVVIVNAACEEDMDVAVLGLLQAAAQGRKFLFRTGAAFVSARLGISPISPLSPSDLNMNLASSKAAIPGGLIIAGSYVPKTTAQLSKLISRAGDSLTAVELDVERLLKGQQSGSVEINNALETAEDCISSGRDVLVMTSRKLITGATGVESLDIGGVVARALVAFLEELKTRPRYLIAKGGITSSDMATKGLRMRRALVVGQAAKGVPLWRCDEPTSKFTSVPYVVFPGNVGTDDTLYEVFERWKI